MFVIDDLLLAPGSFLIWVARKIHEAAQEELDNDTARITAELSELHRALETGAITESQFEAREKALLDRLDRIREETEGRQSADENRDVAGNQDSGRNQDSEGNYDPEGDQDPEGNDNED